MAPVVRIPDLKEIASARVVIALWNHFAIPDLVWLHNKNDEKPPLDESVLESLAKLKVPHSIDEFLQTYIQKVDNELDRWVDYHSNEILYPNEGEKTELYSEMDNIVWYSDGTINYKATARNLLDSLRLSEIEKYHILCWYCLKDEIDRLSPLLFTKNIVDHVDFENDPVIYYWNCYFRNELDKVPVEGGLSLDVFMFRHEYVEWPAKEYFFGRLNEKEQVQNIILLLRENDQTMCSYQKQLLMKLNDNQLQQVYMKRAAKIIKIFMRTQDGLQEILPTWYDVRDLITRDKFVCIFTNLLDCRRYEYDGGVPGTILTEIWTSAGDDFRSHILNHRKRVILEKTLNWFIIAADDSFLSVLLQSANANLIQKIIMRPFFQKCCEDLISSLKLTKLERLFSVLSESGDYLIQFKRNFIESEFFIKSCDLLLKSVEYEEEKDYLRKLEALEQLWNIWFSDVEEVTRFKQNVTKNSSFGSYCVYMLLEDKLPALEYILNLCLPDDGEFEREFAGNYYLLDYCEGLIEREKFQLLEETLKVCFCNIDAMIEFQNNLMNRPSFKRCCKESVKNEKFGFLENLFNFCLRVNTVETTRFKQDLAGKKISEDYFSRLFWCFFWEYPYSQRDLDRLLNLCLPKSAESIQFVRDLMHNSCELKYNYVRCYSRTNSKTIDDFLMRLLFSQSNLVLEFKKHAWMSSHGSADEFKRKIILSPESVEHLQQMIIDGEGLNEVKKRIKEFLPLIEDQRILKKQLIDNLQPKITEIFYKYGHSGWLSLMQWYLEDEKAILELKSKLSIDGIFEQTFKECIFQSYDELHRASRCTLKKNFVFDSLDRLLNWYFESSKQAKDYKIRKINAYESIKTVDTLLKKNCHSSYKTKLIDWFFENDSAEMAKFKKKHEGEQFANMIRIRRESYFKNRRTL
ncbi:uncharacterized protein LOC135832999 isoform X2 [Planococcus citri]|uniref:uncharacterized protein LOC135832999 isoform X2 n=1 Tax=Planococcus citri TaxID=170843 RepID=UPI0031F72389